MQTPRPSKRLEAALLLAAGLIAGLAVAHIPRAEAAAPAYKECIVATTWFARGADVNVGKMPRKALQVPTGWTPIGGTAAPGGPGVVLCR